jgi:hypothetical protein
VLPATLVSAIIFNDCTGFFFHQLEELKYIVQSSMTSKNICCRISPTSVSQYSYVVTAIVPLQ